MEISYVEDRIIFETVVGSRAYGTFHSESDYDKAGVMIPGKEYFYGFDKFEQFQGFPGQDRTIFDLRKALRLITDNNPNMMDLLWSPDHCVVTTSPYWEKIKENRDLFISKKSKFTFSGYAIAQLERIKTHRKFLLDPPKEKPTREKFGLKQESKFPTAQLKAVVYATLGDFFIPEMKDNFLDELDDIYGTYVVPLFTRYIEYSKQSLAIEYLQVGIKAQANTLKSLGPTYIKEEFLEEATKELEFYHASKTWERFQDWQKHRNKTRAELEIKFGYDAKHAMHLVRLLRMGKEILQTGKVNVDRTSIDAEELKEIRNGSWSYEQVEEYSKNMDAELDELYKVSTLQKIPQFEKIKELCVNVCEEYLTEGNMNPKKLIDTLNPLFKKLSRLESCGDTCENWPCHDPEKCAHNNFQFFESKKGAKTNG